jgi:predicted S18 family serine protease
MWQRLEQTRSLEERLAEEAKRLREQAKLLPPGAVREAVLQKARLTEKASQMNAWLASAGLQPPK